MTDLELLQVQLSSAFVFDGDGRIVCQNDPDRTAASRAVLSGCARGNLCFFHRDVAEEQAQEIRTLFATEPPLASRTSLPVHLGAYRALLSSGHAEVLVSPGVNFVLPHSVDFASDGVIVRSDTEEGHSLYERFARDGMPESLVALGFKDVGELWAPWCAVLVEGEVASLGFAARLGDRGADIGVITVPAFRGRGLAAAVTAVWATLPELESRRLFYSTAQTNVSSQRVAARLGLRVIGASCRLG